MARKLTKKNLREFVEDWTIELDENPQIRHPADILHDLECQFGLVKAEYKKNTADEKSTLTEIFDEVPF